MTMTQFDSDLSKTLGMWYDEREGTMNNATWPDELGERKFRGVYWYGATCRFLAQFRRNNQLYYVGYFLTQEEAAKAYDTAIRQWGVENPDRAQFNRYNFPQVGEKDLNGKVRME